MGLLPDTHSRNSSSHCKEKNTGKINFYTTPTNTLKLQPLFRFQISSHNFHIPNESICNKKNCQAKSQLKLLIAQVYFSDMENFVKAKERISKQWFSTSGIECHIVAVCDHKFCVRLKRSWTTRLSYLSIQELIK